MAILMDTPKLFTLVNLYICGFPYIHNQDCFQTDKH